MEDTQKLTCYHTAEDTQRPTSSHDTEQVGGRHPKARPLHGLPAAGATAMYKYVVSRWERKRRTFEHYQERQKRSSLRLAACPTTIVEAIVKSQPVMPLGAMSGSMAVHGHIRGLCLCLWLILSLKTMRTSLI